jgi:hypothetical protein
VPLQTAGLSLANSSFQSEAGLGGDKAESSVSSPGPAALLCLISAFGTKRTSESTHPMSAFGGKADIENLLLPVRF